MFITDWLFEIFDTLSSTEVLLVIFVLFLVDALMIPTLPEVFFVLGYHNNPTWYFGCEMLAAAILGELVGVFSLYYAVRHIRVPKRVANAMNKYIDFLVVSDEKVLLINRIAPMLPFVGAFMAVMKGKWDLAKCVKWLVVGNLVKYGLILLFSDIAFQFVGGKLAQDLMIVFVIAIIVISFIASYIRKKRNNLE